MVQWIEEQLKRLLLQDYVIVLDERGQDVDSEKLARLVAEVNSNASYEHFVDILGPDCEHRL